MDGISPSPIVTTAPVDESVAVAVAVDVVDDDVVDVGSKAVSIDTRFGDGDDNELRDDVITFPNFFLWHPAENA